MECMSLSSIVFKTRQAVCVDHDVEFSVWIISLTNANIIAKIAEVSNGVEVSSCSSYL